MRIIELVLFNYKRFSLNNIKEFTYRPQMKAQLILGTNGSGKSSLLSELSPLPSRSKDFFDDGYKLIKIEHRGNLYILKS